MNLKKYRNSLEIISNTYAIRPGERTLCGYLQPFTKFKKIVTCDLSQMLYTARKAISDNDLLKPSPEADLRRICKDFGKNESFSSPQVN